MSEKKQYLRLRPHHLLCTQMYRGTGYSLEFINNMDNVMECLRNEKNIEIICGLDDVCCSCPQATLQGFCETEDKAQMLDRKVVAYFNIEEGIYSYQELVARINRMISQDIFADICQDCEWYQQGFCKMEMFKNH